MIKKKEEKKTTGKKEEKIKRREEKEVKKTSKKKKVSVSPVRNKLPKATIASVGRISNGAKKKTAKKETIIKKKAGRPIPKKKEKGGAIAPPSLKYWEAVGRRKTSIARVRLFTKGDKGFTVNGKDYKIYFPTLELQQIITASFIKMKCLDRFGVSVKVMGGGIHSQAEAVRHGTARALVKFNADFQKRLRRAGFLTRDPRMKERKKFGLKRARRAPQWSKR